MAEPAVRPQKLGYEGASHAKVYEAENVVPQRKAVIKSVDMPEDMQHDVVDCACRALDKVIIGKMNYNSFLKNQYFTACVLTELSFLLITSHFTALFIVSMELKR